MLALKNLKVCNLSVDIDWLKEHIGRLNEVAEKIQEIAPGIMVTYEAGAWTTIKLLALAYFVPVYTKIIYNYRYLFPEMIYIDLLAGAGLCKVKDTGDLVAGSAVVATTMNFYPFDKYLLVERDIERANALKKRMTTLSPNVVVFNEDCNECIDNLLDQIPSKAHYLAFVDFEGLKDIKWKTMEQLLSRKGDIIVTFQSSEAARVRGRARNSIADRQVLTELYGNDSWEDCKEEGTLADCLTQKYLEQIENFREIVFSIPIRGKGVYNYDLIFGTRRTRGGNPWLKSFDRFIEKTKNCNYTIARNILDLLKGRICNIEEYF